ncbi:MAG TPA: hypothetical protein VG992_03325 [Candidatus Saccharimonadales bacterium]|nr:hypothetical protein [Candidatus Saccharimonadales bacterium]
MINLLPPEVKQSYRFGRRNISLRRWVLAFLIALVGLGGLTTYGLLSLRQSTTHYQHQVKATEALFAQEKYSQTEAEVKDISNSFKLVVKVLSQEVLFSQMIKQIGALIPDNAALTGLTISQVQGALDISAVASDYSTATQIQVNLADPANKIFSKADLVSISCNTKTAVNPALPCSVTIRALFAEANPFLFINSQPGATP